MARRSNKSKALPRRAAATSRQRPWFSYDWTWDLILFLAVLLVYRPVWSAGYIWDDDLVLTSNPCIVGPLGLKEIWTTPAADICPLTLTTFWFEHACWDLAPFPYHLVNVLLHAASALVLWRVLHALLVPGAWLGAALWALHPVQVESVAWVAEMKNTESGLFYLLALLFWTKYLQSPGATNRSRVRHDYALTLLFAGLAMAAKTSTVILPVILGLSAWWIEGRLTLSRVLKIAPVLLFSLAAILLSLWTQSDRANDPLWARTWPQRLATAGDAIWFYLGKLVWPYPLSLIYPRWTIDATQALSYLPLAAVLLVTLLLWLKRDLWARPYLFAWLYFLAVLLPILGLVSNTYSRYSFVADHFQYLADIAPLALAGAGAGLARLAELPLPSKASLPVALGALSLLVLGIVSFWRSSVFQDKETIWTDTLAKNPATWAGHAELGLVLYDRGQVDAATAELRRSIELNPHHFKAHYNLAIILAAQGQIDAALAENQKALAIDPSTPQVHLAFANNLCQKGDFAPAIAQYQLALQLAPTLAEANYDLAVAYGQMGQLDNAAAQYRQALASDPDFAEAHNNLGLVYAQKGRLGDAIAQFQEAVRLKPDFTQAKSNLAKLQAMAQKNVSR